jgi:hypothetical protein
MRSLAGVLGVPLLSPAGGPMNAEQREVILMNEHHRRQAAEKLCMAINDTLGWCGAKPERTLRGYTGGVVLSQRAAVELTTLALLHRLTDPVACSLGLVPVAVRDGLAVYL